MKPVVVFLLFVVMSVPAYASEEMSFRAFTNGIACKHVVASLDKSEGAKTLAIMVSSFITGSNYAKNRESSIDLKSMLMLTEQYCRQNPDWALTTALIALDQSIDKRMAAEAKKK